MLAQDTKDTYHELTIFPARRDRKKEKDMHDMKWKADMSHLHT